MEELEKQIESLNKLNDSKKINNEQEIKGIAKFIKIIKEKMSSYFRVFRK